MHFIKLFNREGGGGSSLHEACGRSWLVPVALVRLLLRIRSFASRANVT